MRKRSPSSAKGFDTGLVYDRPREAVRVAPGVYALRPASRDGLHRWRMWRRKRQAIEYLGGVCASCGHDGWLSQMHIDHIDASRKRQVHSDGRGTTYFSGGSPVTKALDEADYHELDGCQLLCANCHALKGAGSALIEYVYTGPFVGGSSPEFAGVGGQAGVL